MARTQPSTLDLATAGHPGEIVREHLECRGWRQRELASRTGLPPTTIRGICGGEAPVTPTAALAFERALGRSAHLWLKLQNQYDEAEARRRHLASSQPWADWAGRFPLQEMRKLGYSLSEGHSSADRLLRYFGVASPSTWEQVWQSSPVAYRQTTVEEPNEEAVAAWTREVEIQAGKLNVEEFDEGRLRESLPYFRSLTRCRVSEALDDARRRCVECGVALVVVPGLCGTGISGCARWLADKGAIIGLSPRSRADDDLWFAFFHELGHVLLHRCQLPFVVDSVDHVQSETLVDIGMKHFEDEANGFSADLMTPPRKLERSLVRK